LLSTISIYAQQFDSMDTVRLYRTVESIKKHTEVLSSDSLEGRGTGTIGGNLAAKYIASEFAKYGLKTLTKDNTFYQNIPMHGSYPLKTSELKIFSGEEEITLQLEKDYLLYKFG